MYPYSRYLGLKGVPIWSLRVFRDYRVRVKGVDGLGKIIGFRVSGSA